jgi:hypothetical protein
MAEVEGATVEQRALLEELLAEMPSTRLEAFRIDPWDPMDWDELASLGIARGDPRHARPTGVALVVTRPVDVGVRGEWENELLGIAFRDRSASAGLPPVLAAGPRHARGPLEWSESKAPLPALDLPPVEDGFRKAVDAADARVVALEILRVAGHALAATIEVDEPHSFVRYRFRPLLEALAPIVEPLTGYYLEVRDHEPEPVYVRACFANGCTSGARSDLACCDPFYRTGMMGPPQPVCPILGAA